MHNTNFAFNEIFFIENVSTQPAKQTSALFSWTRSLVAGRTCLLEVGNNYYMSESVSYVCGCTYRNLED